MASQQQIDATRQSFEDELKPVGPVQALLVQRIVMAAWRLERLRLIEGGIFQLRAYDDTRQLQTEYKDVPPRTRLAFLYLRDVRGPNALTLLGRYEARIERSFYRALHELERLQAAPENKLAKQSQSAPEPEPPQDFTPPSITQSPTPSPTCALNPSPGAGQVYDEFDPSPNVQT